MPSTVNGIGTWYYGKDHLVTRSDRCEFCGSHEELKSYDTTLYFVVVFIPLIPLGRKRIIDECPRCKRHRAAKLAEWERRKSEAILESTQAWQQDRTNKDKAIAAVGTAIGFHDPESFRQLAGPVGDAFPRDADVQIFLGDAHELFGDAGMAESCYRTAMTSRPDEPTREAFARFLLRQTRPADAEPLLSHILSNKMRPKAMLMLGLAEAYQAVGDHESAFRIVDEVGTAFPDMLSDPNYEKIRRSISKHRGTGKAVKPKYLDRRDGMRQTSWVTRHMGLVILGTIVTVAATWYLGLAWSLGKHTVSLVNGTPSAYTVDINGQRFTIPPMNRTAADIREGTLKISVPDGSAQIAPMTVEMRTNFWRRPWNRRTMVINPDRTAMVYWEQTQYGGDQNAKADFPYRYYIGQALYDLDKADYVFTPFPEKIRMSEKSKAVTKTRVDMIHYDAAAMAALAAEFPADQQIEFLRQHLTDRPIRVQFHRRYQDVIQKEKPDYDVAGDYRRLLAANPDDSTLMYLTARTVDDRDEAVALFRKAADAAQPSAFANYALSNDAMNSGDFPESLRRAQRARKLDSDGANFRFAEWSALEALGRYDEALAVIRDVENPSLAVQRRQADDELRLLASKPDPSAARPRLDKLCKDLSEYGVGPEVVTQIRVPLEGTIAYATGDMPAWRASVAAQSEPEAAFAVALQEQKVDAAQAALAQLKPPAFMNHLLVYIIAQKAGKDDVAKAAWSRAMELVIDDHRSGRRLAASLSGSEPPSDKALRDWVSQPMERCVLMTALGLRYPQKQAEYFPLAKKLSYSRQFPQRLIDQILSGAR